MLQRSVSVICALLIAIFAALLAPTHRNAEAERKTGRSGAREALDFWTQSRAYPGSDIPAAAYYAAYSSAKSRVKEVSRSISASSIWEPIGPINLQGRSLSVAINPQNPRTIYVGTASGGLWRSHSEGSNGDWKRITLGYPALGISAIVIDPADSNTIYIGTGEVYRYLSSIGGLVVRTTRGSYGIGILKTTDGGTTWSKSLDWTMNQQRGVQKLAMNPFNPNTVFAATSEGIYKTTDAGAHWTNTLEVLMGEDVVIHAADTNLIMVSMGNFNTPGAGVYISVDAGDTWFPSAGLPPFNGKTLLGGFEGDPNVVYASVATDSVDGRGAVWKTTDFGSNWSVLPGLGAGVFGVQGWYSHIVAAHPTDPLQILHAGVPSYKSRNGGLTFSGVSGSYSDNHGYAIHPYNRDILYVVNDDGVYRSTNFGDSFSNIGFGMQSGQFYSGFSSSSQDSLLAIGQSQDHIPGYIYRGSLTWGRSGIDESGWTAIDPTDDHNIFAGTRFGGAVFRSTDRGTIFSGSYPFNETGAWNSPFIISPSSPNVLYFGDQRIYKSTTGGLDFSATNNNVALDDNPALSMAISATNPDTLYVGMAPQVNRSHVFRTTDGGITWSSVTGTLPDRYPMDLAVDPKNSAVVYAAMGGFGSGHFFKSTNAGGSWSDITGTLPDVPGTAVAIDPLNPSIVYVGNDIGVYVSTDGGGSWASFSDGLPDAVIASDLSLSPLNRALRVVTHGNGVYERSLLGQYPENYFDYRAFSFYSPPSGAELLEGVTISPIVATFRNSGVVVPAESVDVTYRILSEGAALYSSTRRIASLAAAESRQVTFEGSFLPPQPGVYTMEAIINVVDSNGVNDTLRSSFSVSVIPTVATASVTKDYCPYVEITGGIAGPSGDDQQTTSVLPFSFVYDGYAYTSIQISTNGWVELGTGTAGTVRGLSTPGQLGSYFTQSMGTTARPTKVLAPWWTDLATGSIGSIAYKVTGTTPNRVATIQWKNVAANYDESTTTMKLNFQVLLHEGTNEVEFRYGPVRNGSFSGGSAGAVCGFKDHIGGNYHYYDLARGGSGLSAELIQSLTPENDWPGQDSCYHIMTAGLLAVDDEPGDVPSRFVLRQNYPNPFNPTTTIAYDLPERVFVSLRVYDLLGKEVARLIDGIQEPGFHEQPFNASGLPSGVYFYRLTAGSFSDSRKLLLLR